MSALLKSDVRTARDNNFNT
uniref:Uncharacterized protein n=1 Tax=Anguilla anguilla TaxID=7936 RepID=A0A0E9VQE3_ANGAN